MTRRLVPCLLMALVCLSGSAAAQDAQPADPPAHISIVDGSAILERDGRPDNAPASMPLLAGDRIRTQGGRVEVLFADGSALHLDANTTVDFQSDEVVRLLEGRIRLSIAGPARDLSYRVDAPAAWVQIADPGEYRVAVIRDDDVELAVLRGAAELVNERGRSYIRAGERTFAQAGAAPSPPYVFNSAAWDAFDRWSEARRDQRIGASASYLPEDVRPYAATFDGYGTWRNEPTYGYVWYPRVQVGWRPYYHGRWASLRPYGWTWIAGDPWGWPTHHYGRWGFSAGAWFWIPGRSWSPAWVSWAYATDYVSWCPLGWNNRPVFQFVNVSYYGGRRYGAWDGWTAVSRRHFGGSYFAVSSAAVRLDARAERGFVIGDRGPDSRYAVGRASAIRTPGRYAVPRGAIGAGPGVTRSTSGVEGANANRGFPAPARAPRDPGALRGDDSSRAGSRAVPRERSAGAAPSQPEAQRPVGPSFGSRDAGPRERAQEQAPSSSAPGGAVRAVPRSRGGDELRSSPGGVYQERSRSRDERAMPSAPAPAGQPSYRSTPPPRPGGEVDVYRPSGRYRSAPDGDTDYRGRSMPRNEPRAETPRNEGPRNDAPSPSFRPAPERRAPSGPPPSAAPSGGDRGGDRGGGRQRSGDSGSSGHARRRG